jgi:hypothetical protein
MGAIGAINPKSVYQAMGTTRKSGAPIVSKEVPMLRAYSKKYAGRALLVGNTSFSFGEDGFCEVEDLGNTSVDFGLLLKKHHIYEALDEEECEIEEESCEEDLREGIDAELLDAEEAPLEEDDEEEALEEEELEDLAEPDMALED